MTAKKRVKIGLWVTIAGLILSVLCIGGGGTISYGKLEQRVSDTSVKAYDNETRSIGNQTEVSELKGMIGIVISNQKIMMER